MPRSPFYVSKDPIDVNFHAYCIATIFRFHPEQALKDLILVSDISLFALMLILYIVSVEGLFGAGEKPSCKVVCRQGAGALGRGGRHFYSFLSFACSHIHVGAGSKIFVAAKPRSNFSCSCSPVKKHSPSLSSFSLPFLILIHHLLVVHHVPPGGYQWLHTACLFISYMQDCRCGGEQRKYPGKRARRKPTAPHPVGNPFPSRASILAIWLNECRL